jgi:hypothetical protein
MESSLKEFTVPRTSEKAEAAAPRRDRRDPVWALRIMGSSANP